jgi:hypothetical protein
VRWACATCGVEHDDLPLDWAFDAPLYWEGPRGENDELSPDLCIWTDDDGRENFFIRGVLELPVIGSGDVFAYGVWSSLSEDSFRRVVEMWEDPKRTEEPPYFGWLSNAIPDFPDTVNLPLSVVTRELDQRPCFELHDGDHPLVAAQREGVTLDFVFGIAAKNLHPV